VFPPGPQHQLRRRLGQRGHRRGGLSWFSWPESQEKKTGWMGKPASDVDVSWCVQCFRNPLQPTKSMVSSQTCCYAMLCHHPVEMSQQISVISDTQVSNIRTLPCPSPEKNSVA
jgi:hypothetical protein